ncbi:MAG: hypothetical protein ABEI97_01290 [Candidatus Nanohaloarchaea archaeon]
MSRPTGRELFWLATGTVLVSTGGTLAVLHSFTSSFIPVMGGIFLFILGYKVSWYGSKPDTFRRDRKLLLERINDDYRDERNRLLKETVHLVAGAAMISYGVYLFGQTVQTPTLLTAAQAGIASFGGYIIAHTELNNAVL